MKSAEFLLPTCVDEIDVVILKKCLTSDGEWRETKTHGGYDK